MYDNLVAKLHNIDSTGFVLKTKYDTDKSDLEKKIPDTNSLVKKTDLNANITNIESKIPNITNPAADSALTAVKNKIPNVSTLVKKADYNAKVLDIENNFTDHNHDEYITASEFNKLTIETFKARLAQANFSNVDSF